MQENKTVMFNHWKACLNSIISKDEVLILEVSILMLLMAKINCRYVLYHTENYFSERDLVWFSLELKIHTWKLLFVLILRYITTTHHQINLILFSRISKTEDINRCNEFLFAICSIKFMMVNVKMGKCNTFMSTNWNGDMCL